MAKYWTTELENKVAADCLQLHGGWGESFHLELVGGGQDMLVNDVCDVAESLK